MEQNETNTEAMDVMVTDEDKAKLALTPEQQKIFDDMVREATRKAAERAEKKASAKLKEIEEAERLKNMSESEKQAEIIKKYQARIAELEKKELTNQFKIELTNAGLPKEFADIIPVSDADKAKEAIDFFKKYKDGIVDEYEKKIKELESQLKAAQMRTPAPKTTGTQPVRSASPQFEAIFNQIKNKR